MKIKTTITHTVNRVTYTVKLFEGGTLEWSDGITSYSDYMNSDYGREPFNQVVAKAKTLGYKVGMVVWSLQQ